MFGRIKNLFSPAQATAKRISGLVLSVFVLQVVAAGFCVSTASAVPVQQVSAMEHCFAGNMQTSVQTQDIGMSKVDMNQSMVNHTCSHCDMPNVNISFDKHSFNVADIAVDFVVVALVPTVSDVTTATFVVFPPDLQTQYTSLSTYNLNLRIRV
ncbi:hypothetical protein [Ghiorsea bivora]|uniref:hypothetical protein n=1 Tax=Ghiorsea bivora TaxID=1485545 RepID=UPI00056EC1FE|nr:hypothetical protein [Ghiorsea bivora]